MKLSIPWLIIQQDFEFLQHSSFNWIRIFSQLPRSIYPIIEYYLSWHIVLMPKLISALMFISLEIHPTPRVESVSTISHVFKRLHNTTCICMDESYENSVWRK